MPVFTEAHLTSLLGAVASSQFTENALEATAVRWCQANGFTATERKPKEVKKMDPLKTVENLTTRHGSLDAAMDTAEGRQAYSEYRESLLSGQHAAPAGAEEGPADTRNFTGDKAGASVRTQERSFNERVDALLVADGKTMPTEADRAAAAARLVESEPQLYAEYMKSLRGANQRQVASHHKKEKSRDD